MSDSTMRAKRAMQALRAADQRGVGQVAGGMGAEAIDRLAALDECTLAYRTWSPRVVPGLLQTPAYTAGAIKSHTPGRPTEDVGPLVTHRRRRSEAFFNRRAHLNGCLAWFLIGENAIRYPLMNAHSHAEQLRQLLSQIEEPNNVVIQVLPVDTPIPVTAEPFSLFVLDPGPIVGHLETAIGGFYTITTEDIATLNGAFSDMVGRAMSTRDSREFIREELYGCSGSGQTSAYTAEPTTPHPVTPTPKTVLPSPSPEASA
jgi:hypothetical protein